MQSNRQSILKRTTSALLETSSNYWEITTKGCAKIGMNL